MKRDVMAALTLAVLLFGGAYLSADKPQKTEETPDSQPLLDASVTLAVKDGGAVTDMALDDYLRGVVRGEMPAAFALEALKAQAAAERTYVYYQLAAGRKDSHPDADVCTDHTCCSAYLSEAAAREKWGGDYAPWEQRIEQAVAETDGQVALYGGEPILAVFHSSSSGKTAAAGDVWSGDLPYLKSVTSPETEDTVPNYYSTVRFTTNEAKALLLAAYPDMDLSGAPSGWIGTREENDSGRVAKLTIGGVALTGTEVRRVFALRSAAFTVEGDGEGLTFRVTGYGHGVGMSQYGADKMAQEGSTWREILAWYYPNTTIGTMETGDKGAK